MNMKAYYRDHDVQHLGSVFRQFATLIPHFVFSPGLQK